MSEASAAVQRRPRVGVTCSSLRVEGYYQPYLDALEGAGADAVVIERRPARPEPAEAAGMLEELDGLLVPGGWDIDPQEYGAAPAAELTETDPLLDGTEVALVRAAVETGTPVLGICRGQQLINVALGGTLHQHIVGHDGHSEPRDRLAHAVEVEPGSMLAAIAPAPLLVNSLHHQAVRDVAPRLRVTGRSEDGVVEALESPDGAVVAVQSHPEELVASQAWARELFARFVQRAAERAQAAAGTGVRPAG